MKRNTCDKCRHYTPTINPKKPHDGKCAQMGDANFTANAVDRCSGWDYESYRAGVYVGPKFGCIHWEKKP
jgi:hypothetical protein